MQTALSAVLLDVLSTGVLTTTASSNIDGLPGFRTASGASTVNDLVIGILGVIALTADTVSSTAQVDGTPGAITGRGNTSITNLKLNNVSVSTAVLAPNTVILNTGGVKVTLNEQVSTGSGNAQGLQVNAISIALTNALQPIVGDFLSRVNTYNGTIVIGHSEASLVATTEVPEPASLALLAAGMVGLGAVRRRAKES